MAEGIEVRHAKGCRALSRRTLRLHAFVSSRASGRTASSGASASPSLQLAEAKAWRAEALVALRQGTLRAPVPETVSAAASAWLVGAREGTVRDRSGRSYKPSTIRTYAEKLESYVLPALGDYRLSELRRPAVQALADRMLAAGLAPSTVRNAIDPLRAIYRRAMQRDEVAINPTSNLDLPASRKKRDRIASPAEARALLEALPPPSARLGRRLFTPASGEGNCGRSGVVMSTSAVLRSQSPVRGISMRVRSIRNPTRAPGQSLCLRFSATTWMNICLRRPARATSSYWAERQWMRSWRRPFEIERLRRGTGPGCADHAPRVPAHVRVVADRVGREPEGCPGVHGSLDDHRDL